MWPFRIIPKQILLTIQEVGIKDHTQLVQALSGEHITYTQYAAMRLPALGALELAKLLLIERYSPLRRLKETQIQGTSAASEGYTILLGFLFYSLKNVMANDDEVSKFIGISHDELISKFCSITDLPSDRVKGDIASIEEKESAHSEAIHPEMYVDGYQTTIDFCTALTSDPPEISPTNDFEFFFIFRKTRQFLFQHLREDLEQHITGT